MPGIVHCVCFVQRCEYSFWQQSLKLSVPTCSDVLSTKAKHSQSELVCVFVLPLPPVFLALVQLRLRQHFSEPWKVEWPTTPWHLVVLWSTRHRRW